MVIHFQIAFLLSLLAAHVLTAEVPARIRLVIFWNVVTPPPPNGATEWWNCGNPSGQSQHSSSQVACIIWGSIVSSFLCSN